MEWLAENFVTILVVGGLLTLVLGIAYSQTRHRGLLLGALGVGLLTLICLLWERATETPREAVRQTILDLAQALETNDLSQVLPFLASDAQALRQEAQQRLPLVEITEANVKSDLKVTFTETDQSAAEATFHAVIMAKPKTGEVGLQRVPSRWVLSWVREGAAWKLTHYERHEIIGR